MFLFYTIKLLIVQIDKQIEMAYLVYLLLVEWLFLFAMKQNEQYTSVELF